MGIPFVNTGFDVVALLLVTSLTFALTWLYFTFHIWPEYRVERGFLEDLLASNE